MNTNLRIVILICGFSFFIAIIRMLLKNKFNEKVSIIWFIGAIGVFIISLFPKLLDKTAKLFGADYPPSILFLGAILILLLICFNHSVHISVLESQVRELAQRLVVKDTEHKENM